MVAVELAVRALVAAGHRNKHFVLRSDNQGVVGALAAGRSRGRQENSILQHILQLFDDHSIWLTIVYVPTADNIADGPSRGVLPTQELQFEAPPRVPPHLVDFIVPVT
ncbi:hypothetical protein B0H16DRAFT_1413939 [Mycena metata]|uniref:Uncharacterized protein n=1 Tax=Mycena metata TaxID=1033252 RepID=A0AAD7JGE3_9AGAR|nr:hypothetical protein B0H16DRAFT_1413939 [Mycena metata]